MTEYTNISRTEDDQGLVATINGITSTVPATFSNRDYRKIMERKLPIAKYAAPVESLEEKARLAKRVKDKNALQIKLGITKAEMDLLTR